MKSKIIILMILIVLFTIFVSQNTDVVTVNAYFWQFKMSIIVLISLTVLLGIILGFIIAKLFDRSSGIKPARDARENSVKED